MPSTVITKDDGIYWNDTRISFLRKINNGFEYLTIKDINYVQTECGWEFHVSNSLEDAILGIMIPINSELLIYDRPADLYKSKRYYYSPARELERLLKINPKDVNKIQAPIIHLINKDRTYSWSCPNECLISTFVSQYQWYVNLEVHAWESLTFFLDESTNYLINMQRFPHSPSEILINETTSIKSMEQALLTGSRPRSLLNESHKIVQVVRELQLELLKHNFTSIIIGSLARRLNGIPVDVNDIDIMFLNKKELNNASLIMRTFSDTIQINEKNAKFKYQNYYVELCFDNYNILTGKNYTIQKHGLTYVDIEGLLWLYMINLLACNLDEHSDDYKNHVLNALVSIHQIHSTNEFRILPYAKEIPDYSKKCTELCTHLSLSEMKYVDVRINKPFTVRCFQKDHSFLYPIVNLGSKCDAEIAVNCLPHKSIWKDISGREEPLKADLYNGFSLIHISEVELPGVLECQI